MAERAIGILSGAIVGWAFYAAVVIIWMYIEIKRLSNDQETD